MEHEKKHDIGVLFVHGLGIHQRGATLLHYGSPLIRCIDNLLYSDRDGYPAAAELLTRTDILNASVHTPSSDIVDPPSAEVHFADIDEIRI